MEEDAMLIAFWRVNQSHHNAMIHRHQWKQKSSNFMKKKNPKKDMNYTKNARKFETNTHQS